MENNLILCFGLTGKSFSTSLFLENSFIDEMDFTDNHNLCEKIIGSFDTIFQKNKFQISQLKKIITSTGPGSYTGLRIQLSTAKAFAFANNIPIVTVLSTEIRALAWLDEFPNKENLTQIAIQTQIGNSKELCSFYEFKEKKIKFKELIDVKNDNDILKKINETDSVLLLDEGKEKINFSKQYLFPLKSSYLGFFYQQTGSMRNFDRIEEWGNLSPDY